MKHLALTLTMMFGLILTTADASFADIQSTRNFYEFSDRLLTTGQPSETALKNASKDGVEVVINLVPPSESIFNPKEKEILKAQGIEYVHIPVSWRTPDPADLEEFPQGMKRVGDKKCLFTVGPTHAPPHSPMHIVYRKLRTPKALNGIV